MGEEENILKTYVPGVTGELRLAGFARRDDIDAVIAIGLCDSGETKHDYINHAVAQGLKC
jgi:6,7-dimethyl-8-ribityllumazine synthase